MNFPRRFIFRGNASGVAAHLRRPANTILPVQAASSLPVIGGTSVSKAGPSSPGGYVQFDSAETSAQGDFVDQEAAEAMTRGEVPFDSVPTRTTVTANVRGLSVGGERVFIAAANAGLISHSPRTGEKEPSIQLANTQLEGVKVDQHFLTITFATDLFTTCDTLAKLTAAYAKGLSATRAGMFFNPAGPARSETLPSSNGTVYCTIVEKIEWSGPPHPTAMIAGNLLTVPDFGKVYFGELLITGQSRRLTLVRMQLGSPDGGDMVACEVESNGDNWPS